MERIRFSFMLVMACLTPYLYVTAQTQLPNDGRTNIVSSPEFCMIKGISLIDPDEPDSLVSLENGSILNLTYGSNYKLVADISGNLERVRISVSPSNTGSAMDFLKPYEYPESLENWTPQPGKNAISVTTYELLGVCALYSIEVFVCYNVSDGGFISGHEAQCGPYDPQPIYSQILPSGGAGDLEYLWMKSTSSAILSDDNMGDWTPIPDANGTTLDPEPITETTYYIRCARGEGCGDYTGESNVIKKEVMEAPWLYIPPQPSICKGESQLLVAGTYQSFESMHSPGSFIGHDELTEPGWTTFSRFIFLTDQSSIADKQRGTLRVVQGLSDEEGISFESVSHPGYYLAVSGSFVRLFPATHDAAFRTWATFYPREGLADPKGLSFESASKPGSFIQTWDSMQLYVANPASNDEREAATFYPRNGWTTGPFEMTYQWNTGSTNSHIVAQPAQTTAYSITATMGDCNTSYTIPLQVDVCNEIDLAGCEGVLGVAAPYNLLVFDQVAELTDAVQGRVAIGGNATLSSMAIGQRHSETGSYNLEEDAERNDLIVGGDLVVSNGVQINSGKFSFTGGFQLSEGGFTIYTADGPTNVDLAAAASYRLPPPFDFGFVKYQMKTLSETLAQLNVNAFDQAYEGEAVLENSSLILRGSSGDAYQTYLFFVSEVDIESASEISLEDLPTGATVIVNVSGENIEIGNIGWRGFEGMTNGMLFNFLQASTLSVRSFKGSILAPEADFTASNGEIWGQVIVDRITSFSSAQIHHHPFRGCIYPPLSYGDDLSDAPLSYPIARHTYDASRGGHITYLGKLIDFELEAFHTVDALGDDTDCMDDEDGITFPGGATAGKGENKTLEVTVYSELEDAFLNIWVDFNGDGDFQDEGEQVTTDEAFDNPNTPEGETFYRTLVFTVPADAICGETFLRARLVNEPGILASGDAITGEVEDYLFTITCDQGGPHDFGDAPLVYGDPSHEIEEGVALGVLVDSEMESQHSSLAMGDDKDGNDDDDGLELIGGPLVDPGSEKHYAVTVQNTSGNTYYLCAWADTDADGEFETVMIDDIPFEGNGTYSSLEENTPMYLPAQNEMCGDKVFVRLRLSNVQDVSSDAEDVKGEVEDYALVVTCATEQYEAQGILPVDWLSFDANNIGQHVKLDWATGQEENNAYFDVERSYDGTHFTALGQVPGAGSIAETQYYQYVDKHVSRKQLYYRIRQVDFNGEATYSKIVEVKREERIDHTIAIYPVPASDELHVVIPEQSHTEYTCTVYDKIGNQVLQSLLQTEGRQNVETLDIKQLNPGVYIIQIKNAYTHYAAKFVKK